jgi:tetratricopeptide (TPR) repeat protein
VEPHLSREKIARFAGQCCPPAEAREIYAHLIGCRACSRAYAARVGTGSPWLRADSGAAAFLRPLRWRRRRSLALALAAGLAWLGIPDSPSPFAPDPVLAGAVGRVSAAGFVLPGAERHGETETAVYRSGAIPGNVADALVRAIAVSRERPRCTHAAAWGVAGLLAADRLDEARIRAENAARRFPRDPRFPLLRAAVAYRESRLDEVERHLRASLAIEPRGLAARFDLALLLSETGRPEEAAEVARSIVADAPDTLPARRAEALLASLR